MSGATHAISGILNVDKPLGWTSHDVVALARRLTGVRQVGHAGTLDPLATGVLLVMVGAATRVAEYAMHGRKCYLARLRLGVRTSTDDGEGEVLEIASAHGVTREQVIATLRRFRGDIQQVPPAYAAIKQGGIPSYKLARRGVTPQMAPRAVRIDGLALTRLESETLDLLVWCGAGTYIRALARDVGAALGCGAHLAALRRLSSGAFDVDRALGVSALRAFAEQGRLHEQLLPVDSAVATWPALILDDPQACAVLHGRVIPGPAASGDQMARVYAPDGRLLALARYAAAEAGWQPVKVLASPDQRDGERMEQRA